jgi:hypothetical protein
VSYDTLYPLDRPGECFDDDNICPVDIRIDQGAIDRADQTTRDPSSRILLMFPPRLFI